MPQYEDEFEFDTEERSGSDLVKDLRKQLNEMSRALKERDEQLAEYAYVTREQELAEALVEYGVNPKIAAFIPDDVEDEDDLVGWLNEYGDVFGVGVAEDDGVSVDEDTILAAELMSTIEDDGIDPTLGRDLAALISDASSSEELAAILKG